MTRQRQSLQDRIRNRQQSSFAGRQGEIAQYQENLGLALDDIRRRFLFNIHGDAGVGKTYLTKQLQQIAIDNGVVTAYVDETVGDTTTAMTVMAEQFSRGGARLTEFEKRAASYQQRRHELESDPHAPNGVAVFLTKTAVTIGLAAARDVPIAGSLLAPLDAAATADQIDRARRYLARKFSDHADVRLLLSPLDELTPVFVSEVNRIGADRPVALFFDTYERTGLFLDRWLRDLYQARHGQLPDTLIITISGQTPLNPNLWGEYLGVIADVSLEPFSEAEARQFLASKGVSDEATVQVILTLSGNLPMWLATLAQARPVDAADIGDPAGDAVERFLKWEDDPTRRSTAMTAALPRMLNQDVLASIAPTGDAREAFHWLCGRPFVTRKSGSWAYHEVVRAAMLRLQFAQAPSEWRSHHMILAKANERWANDASADSKRDWANSDWVNYTCEKTYHLLCADPVKSLPEALASAVEVAAHGVIRARQWAQLISDAGRDTNNQKIASWGKQLHDGIHDDDLTQYFTHLIDDAHLSEKTMTIALRQRGLSHRRGERYDEALADLNRAIEFKSGQDRAIADRGETYRLMERYEEAAADFTRAIELDPANAWAIASRGQTYQEMERYEEAMADLTRAIELDADQDWPIAERGVTYRRMERYEEAVADFTRAIELDPAYAWAIAWRGLTYQAMERYEEAVADFTRAIELDPANAWAIAYRGEIYRLMERYEEAVADFTRAIELDPANAWAIASRGQTYREMERYEEAVADLTRAIELDADQDWPSAERGVTYRRMERYEEAVADFTRAIELDPGYAWAIAWRGLTYQAMERYEEAVADLTRAIELDPDAAWAIAWRGATYQDMERYEEAVADLTRAIELDPANAWAIAERGVTYRRMERYEEAAADLTRAIELDPDQDWAIADRGETYRLMERYEEAVADFTRAIELDPDQDWAIADRGETYRLMERYEEAVADFTRAIELDPDDAEYTADRGETYRLMKRYEEAVADFTRAIELDPDDAEYTADRGETYRLMKRYEEAVADFTRAIELDPGYAWAIASRGQTYREMERHEEAVADLTRAIELKPDLDWAIAERGVTYRLMKRYEEAVADFTRAIELDPDDAEYTADRGETYRLMKRYEEAVADLTRAIDLKPDYSWAITRLDQTRQEDSH